MNTKELLSEFEFHGRSIPDYMHGGIIRYLEEGIEPGDFLSAVISNDLREAVGRADDNNIELLHVYVAFFYTHAPTISWGSRDIMERWIEHRRSMLV